MEAKINEYVAQFQDLIKLAIVHNDMKLVTEESLSLKKNTDIKESSQSPWVMQET